MEAEKNNNKLQGIIREKEDNLHKLSLINDSLKMNLDQANNTKNKMTGDVEKYKSYIITLTEQTQKLTEELERIVDEDNRLYDQVNQTDRLCQFVNEQKQILNNEMEEIANCGNRMRSFSPSRLNYSSY